MRRLLYWWRARRLMRDFSRVNPDAKPATYADMKAAVDSLEARKQ